MPRTSKKERVVLKKSETKNKKRKRTEDDGEATGNKRLKLGWIRDIKAVLRSAGNRLVNSEIGQRLESRKRTKNSANVEKVHEMSSISTEEKGELDEKIDFGSNDNETFEGSIKVVLDNTDSTSSKNNHEKLNALEENCDFQLIECTTSGTLIRLEKVSTSSNNGMDWKEIDEMTPGSSGTASEVERIVNEIINVEDEDSIKDIVDEINRCIYSIEDLDENATKQENSIVADTNKNSVDLIKLEDSNNSVNGNFYCDPLSVKSTDIYSDVKSVIGCSLQEERISNSNLSNASENNRVECTLDSEFVGNNGLSNGNASSDEDNAIERVNRCCGDCTDERCPCNVLDGYRPFFSQDYATERSESQDTHGIAQAYYDSNRSAFVESTALQDNKPNSSKSLKNTWGSIKSLISRVSGQRGGGDKSENTNEDLINQTEDDLYA